MDKKQAKARIKQLRKEIDRHRYLYHVQDRQEISDAALDSLKHELSELESKFPNLITPSSPTQRVGGKALPQFEHVQHSTPMLSLQDAFSIDELRQWETRNTKIVPGPYTYFVELKIDGVAVALIYEDGILVQAATRGDGRIGEDVTHNIRTIEAVPLQLRGTHTGRVEVRGEVYILKKDFEKMNTLRQAQGKPLFANPRNIAAGSIRQLNPALAAARPLRYFAWEITAGIKVASRQEEYKKLPELGFAVPPQAKLFPNLHSLQKFVAQEEKRRLKSPFQVDGLVIKINNLALSRRLGVVGKAPRGSLAYKFEAEEATTIVEDIVVQVGRTGALTPVAHLKPVQVAGTTVSRATLHNADEVARKDVRVGDTVIIRKAGDIIPEVVHILPKLRPKGAKSFNLPKVCPVCGAAVARQREGVIIRCTNRYCFSQQRERILHAISKSAFDIEGLGEKVVEKLMEEKLIEHTPDVWDLTVGDLEPLQRFAAKSAAKLVKEIQAHQTIELNRFLVALGIPQIGTVTAQDLATTFRTLEKVKKASAQELAAVPGVGEKVAEEIVRFWEREETKKLLARYKKVGLRVKPHTPVGKLAGQTFVFTGSLGDITREEAKQIVQGLGGRVAATVGSGVDVVVIGEDPGSKARRAKELGIRTISPAQFKKLVL